MMRETAGENCVHKALDHVYMAQPNLIFCDPLNNKITDFSSYQKWHE